VSGKQPSLPNLPSYRAQHHPRGLAGVAAPPPSGAGHRRSPSPSPEPLVACASFPATRSTRSCTKRRPGAHPRAHAGELLPRAAAAAPVPGDIAAARRMHSSRTVGSRVDDGDHVPLQFKWPGPR
jgi:hypothetical protein